MCNFIAGTVCQTTKNSFFSVLLFISTDNGRTRRAISSLLVCVTIRIRKGHTDFIQVSSRIFGSENYLLRTSFETIKPRPQKSNLKILRNKERRNVLRQSILRKTNPLRSLLLEGINLDNTLLGHYAVSLPCLL